MKSKLLSILLTTALTASLGLLGKAGCDRAELMDANDQLNKQLMQADLEKGRALTKFGDAQDYIGKLEKDVASEIKARKALMTRYGELEFQYRTLKKKAKAQKTEVVYVEGKTIEVPAELNLVRGKMYEAITEQTLQPVSHLFGKYEDSRLKLETRVTPITGPEREVLFEHRYELMMDFELQFVESHTPSGAINHYANVWEIDRKTKERILKVPVTKFAVVVEKPDDKQFFWWAPHIDVGALAGAKLTPPDLSLGGSLGFSPFAYGRTVNDLDWRFLRVSFDLADNRPGVGVSPVAFNVGQHLPLFSNIWLAPHVTYIISEGWAVSLFVGAVL